MTSRVTGIDPRQAFAELSKLAKGATVEAIRERAGDLLEDARDRVPVVTGTLRDSGKVDELADGADVVFSADYATDVHENPDSTGYKFLEGALKATSPDVVDDVGELVADDLGARYG